MSLLPAADIDGAAPPAATATLSSSRTAIAAANKPNAFVQLSCWQVKTGYFFCLEDRSLLYRPCDVAVHTAGDHVASHRRFLITGVRVGVGVECHHVPGSDGVGGGVSPSTCSGNPSSSAPSSRNLRALPDKIRPTSSVGAAAAREVLGVSSWLMTLAWRWHGALLPCWPL
nr:B-box zinc finger protein 20-like [Setaria viridis]